MNLCMQEGMSLKPPCTSRNNEPFHRVAIVIGEVARPSPVVVLMVPDHGDGLLNKWRPGHGAVKHNVPLLVHCHTARPSAKTGNRMSDRLSS